MRRERYLPEGLVQGCTLKRDIPKDAVLTYDDVELPPGRLADELRAEQYGHFAEDGSLAADSRAGEVRV
jgi:predicted homoserine dehydrogenase-like protein